jgi:hypothetical protein
VRFQISVSRFCVFCTGSPFQHHHSSPSCSLFMFVLMLGRTQW